ncbi:MAG: hypothetical protein FWF59_07685 [Turicibacter sp.]|nr:hypothetical protein [Turicibacter sp.]
MAMLAVVNQLTKPAGYYEYPYDYTWVDEGLYGKPEKITDIILLDGKMWAWTSRIVL